MLDWLLHQDAALLCLFVGLLAGGAVGFAMGHAHGQIRAFNAMRTEVEPIESAPVDPMQAIRDRMKHIEALGPTGGPFGEF
jgi:hypothetical protein